MSRKSPASRFAPWWRPDVWFFTWRIRAVASPVWTSSERHSRCPAFAIAEDGWQRRGMLSGPPGWAVCHDTAREPRMFLRRLHSEDVRLLNHESAYIEGTSLVIKFSSRIRSLASP